jgi:hypothetical protein
MAKALKSTPVAHETLSGSDDVRMGSERAFGLVIAGALCVISAIRWWHDHGIWYLLVAAGVLAALAMVAPRTLKPLNFLWFRFGLLLHAVITPVVLGVMFYAVITPLGWLMRAFGKRPLSLDRDPAATSYWIHRTPPGPAPDSLSNQF